ncbi:MAG TPA: T9SS type A sorting domain-containing protein, partial [Ferruginibacter sp.]|nr:T9SS type A sorting domain-containing protein [Ferruginibacter sp.]
ATITLFKGATSIGTTTVSSGGAWSINVSGLANNDIITAKAMAIGESQCLTSNEVTVNNCSSTTHTATPAVTCSSLRGFEGTMVSGAAVRLYKLTSAGYVLYANDATTPFLITYPTATTWRYDDANTQSGSACTGGPADIAAGAYVVVAELAPNCASLPLNVCIPGTAAPATPVVTSLLIDGASTISGTALANSGVNLWIDGYFVQSVTATAGGTFSFTLLKKLLLNQQVQINNATTGSCASTAFTAIVSCYISAPVISANGLGQVATGSQLTGTSSAIAGTTVTIYNAVTLAVIGTTTVLANGTWTLASPVVAAGITYNSKITGSLCGNSAASNTVTSATATLIARCGTITGPVTESATTIAGTVTTAVANTTVTLYVDGISVGSVVIAGTAWSIPVNTTVNNTIYSGAVLTIGITESAKTEITCAASVTVSCTIPTTPSISPTMTAILVGQTVTYTFTTTQSGILYSIRDNADATNLGGSGFGNGATIMLTTDPFATAGTYTVKLKATSFSGPGCETTSSATVFVTGLVPVGVTDFTGKYINGISRLNWVTSFEQDLRAFEIERSFNGRDFKTIGMVQAVGNSTVEQHYTFDDADANSKKLVYYRLNIIEISSKFSYSKILLLRTDKGIVINQLGPNPFSHNLLLSIDVANNHSLVIRINDMAGRNIKMINYPAKKGLNIFNMDGLDKLASGNYIIELLADEERINSQLLLKK